MDVAQGAAMTEPLRQTYLLPDDGGAFLERIVNRLPESFSSEATLDTIGHLLAMVPHAEAVKARLAWGDVPISLAADDADGWTCLWVHRDYRSACDEALLAVFCRPAIWLEPVSCTFKRPAEKAMFDVAYSVEIAPLQAALS